MGLDRPSAYAEVHALMEMTDALGRRRRPTQNRGLRSLFPKLPSAYRSRLLRLAMSGQAWERLERLVTRSAAPTLPRAYGEVVERLLENCEASSRAADWQAWQMQKELALLAASTPARWGGMVTRGVN